MALQWMPQNLQKRLLRYILSQLSLFSEIDLPNVDVSLGISTNSKINLRDLQLDPDKFNLPGIYVRDGKIIDLELILNMSDGVNVDINGLTLTIAIAQTLSIGNNIHNNNDTSNEQFSLAKSTVDLAQSVMFDDNDDIDDDNVINSESDLQESSKVTKNNDLSTSPHKSDSQSGTTTSSNNNNNNNNTETKMSSMMSKAVDIALGRLQVEIKNAKVIIIWDSVIYEAVIDQISFSSIDGVRNIDINGIHIALVKPVIETNKKQQPTDTSLSNEQDLQDEVHEKLQNQDDTKLNNEDNKDSDNSDNSDDDDDEDYNEEMMTSSFMVDASTKEEKATVMDSMMFSNDHSSMFMTATSEVFRSKSVMFEEREQENDEEDDDDEKEEEDEKEKETILKLNKPNSTFTFIDKLSLSFEGLQDITNLNVEIGTVKSSAVSLTAALSYIIKSLKHAQQLNFKNNTQPDFQTFKTYSSPTNERETAFEKLTATNNSPQKQQPSSGSNKENFIENIFVSKIIVSISSQIDDFGEFFDDNGIKLITDNIVFSQRSSKFSYGSIESIKIVQNEEDKIFYFDQPNMKKSSHINDLKFETLQSNDEISSTTTLLCSKNAIFNLDFSTVSEFMDFYKLILPFINILYIPEHTQSQTHTNSNTNTNTRTTAYRQTPRPLNGLINSNARFDRYSNFQSPGFKDKDQSTSSSTSSSEFNAQTSSIIINLKLSKDLSLRITILPLDFSSLKGEIETTRLTVEYVLNNDSDTFITPLLLINEIKYTSFVDKPEKIKVKSYDTNTLQEVINEALNTLIIDSIAFNSDFKNLQLLIQTVQSLDFNSLLPTSNETKQHQQQKRVSGGANSDKTVRLGASIFSRPNKLIDFHLLFKSIDFKLTNINDKFGDLTAKLDTLGINILKDADMTLLFIQKITMDRLFNSGNLLEPVISMANRDFGGNSPSILAKLRSFSNSIYLKNLALNYYGIWFKYFEENNDNNNTSFNKKIDEVNALEMNKSNSKKKSNYQFVFSDISIGLNPVNLNSKAELVINKATGDLSIFENSRTTFELSSRSVNVLLIDDKINILSDIDSRNYRQWLSNQPGSGGNIANWTLLSVLKSKGFAQVGKISNLFLNFTNKPDSKYNLSGNGNNSGNNSSNDSRTSDANTLLYSLTELNVSCNTLNVDLCADSSQCMLQLFKDLKEPVQFTTEEKFKTDAPEINVFQDIDIDQYSSSREKFASINKHSTMKSLNNDGELTGDDDKVGDDDEVLSDSPLNIVEDFYNNGTDVDTATSLKPFSSNDTLDNFNLNGPTESTRIHSSESNGGGILKNSNTKPANIYFDDDHFKKVEETDMARKLSNDEIKFKVIPMSIIIKIPKTVIHLYDGYDWKTTQVEIRKAIKRVETKAAAEVERRRLESSSISNTTPSSLSETPNPNNTVVTFAEVEGRPANTSRGSLNSGNVSSYSSTTNSSNVSLDNDNDDDVIGEFLYSSIMLGVKAGQPPSKLTERIDKSINFVPSNDYDTSDTVSYSSPSPTPPLNASSSGINQRKMGSNTSGSTHSNISLGKASGKKLRLKRSRQYKVSIELTKFQFDMKIMTNDEPHISTKPAFFAKEENTDDSELVNSMIITVDDFQILDNVPTSTWNLFTGYLREAGDREVDVSMAKIKIDTVRPISSLAATELVLNISILPLRLYVDQDTLDFLTRFGEFKDTRFIPMNGPPSNGEEDEEIFIEKIQVDAVKIKLDYKPKKVDYAGIKSGHTSEFMNFFILDESVMTLRKLVLYGVPGFSRLNTLLNDQWMPDIKGTQLSGVLSGLAPVKSIVKIGSGFKELVSVPVKEYNKDKRVIRSLQKGVSSFAKITGNELLKFGVKLAAGTQVILENAEEVLGGDGSSARLYIDNGTITSSKTGEVSSISKKNRKNSTDSVSGLIGKKNNIHRGSVNSYNSRGDDSSDDDEATDHPILANASIFVDSSNGDYYVYRPDESAIEADEIIGEDGRITNTIDNGNGDNDKDNDNDDDDDDDFDNEIDDPEEQRVISLYSNQPDNFNDGMRNAYESFGKNMSTAKNAILKASSRAAESGSAQTAVKEIAKATPVMVIRPIIGTTEAISRALLGGINNLDPEEKKKSEEKYKRLH